MTDNYDKISDPIYADKLNNKQVKIVVGTTAAVKLASSNGGRTLVRITATSLVAAANRYCNIYAGDPNAAVFLGELNVYNPSIELESDKYGSLIQGEIYAISGGGDCTVSVTEIIRVR